MQIGSTGWKGDERERAGVHMDTMICFASITSRSSGPSVSRKIRTQQATKSRDRPHPHPAVQKTSVFRFCADQFNNFFFKSEVVCSKHRQVRVASWVEQHVKPGWPGSLVKGGSADKKKQCGLVLFFSAQHECHAALFPDKAD